MLRNRRLKLVTGVAGFAAATAAMTGCSTTSSDGSPSSSPPTSGTPPTVIQAKSRIDTKNDTVIDMPGDICNSKGTSINSVAIYNSTNAPQTAAIWIQSDTANEVLFVPGDTGSASPGGASSAPTVQNGCESFQYGTKTGNGQGQQNWVIQMPPGSSYQGWLVMGGGEYNMIPQGSFTIGGSSTGSAWYDYKVNLGANEGFQSLQPSWSNTGGTSQGNQNGLNIVSCQAPGTDGVQWPTTDVLSGSTGTKTATANSYGSNESMCLNFLSGSWDNNAAYVPGS